MVPRFPGHVRARDVSRPNKAAGTSAQHPSPSPDVPLSRSYLSWRVRARMWGGDTGFSTPHLVILHVLAAGHTASRSHGSLSVYPACLQDAVGRSVALGLYPNKGQKSDLHKDEGDRDAQRARLCLYHGPVCWGPFPAQPSVDFPLLSPEPPTCSWDFHSGPLASWGGQTLQEGGLGTGSWSLIL